jgi:hypothetical protein
MALLILRDLVTTLGSFSTIQEQLHIWTLVQKTDQTRAAEILLISTQR